MSTVKVIPWKGIETLGNEAPSPSSLCDLRTQASILGHLILDSKLLDGPLSDITVSDFTGGVHQSLFRAMLRIYQEGKPFDIVDLAQAWGADKQVGDPEAYVAGLLDAVVGLADTKSARAAADRLHRLSHLRRLRFLGETLQRQAEATGSDPSVLYEKTEVALNALRSGYDVNGQLLPYKPHNLSRRPDLLTLASVTPMPVPWLWRPYLVFNMLNMLSGDPGSGKTFLALAIAASLTTGRIPYIGEPCQPMNVVYLTIENSTEYVLRPRFDSLGGDATRLHILRGAVSGDKQKPRHETVRLSDVELLESAVKQTKARMLVVDPIQSYLGADVDAHRSNETRPIMDGLSRVAQKYDVCIFIVRHMAKSSTGSAIHRGLGSIDLTGAVRSELHAGKREGEREGAMVHVKTNVGEFGKSLGYEVNAQGEFYWTGESRATANDLVAGQASEDERDAISEATETLSDLLREGPKSKNEIFDEMKSAGISPATARRAKRLLGVKSRKRSGSRFGQFEWYLDNGQG